MSSQPARLEARDATGRGLRIEFIRVQDRYAHVISQLDGERVDAVWESVEGTDADDWPPSPPLQQLSIETLADGRRVALLVGMAGTSHWSLSVEAAAGEPAFIFDVACRVKEKPNWLGSSYRRSSAVTESTVALERTSNSCVETSHTALHVQPEAQITRTPCTSRWTYRVCLPQEKGQRI